MPDIKGSDIEFEAGGERGSGYLAQPGDGDPHRGVIVIQEWWGLDGHIRDLADRFAREGVCGRAQEKPDAVSNAPRRGGVHAAPGGQMQPTEPR